MTILHRAFFSLLVAVLLVGALGCSTKPPPASGFLGPDIVLTPDQLDAGRLYYEKPGVKWERYTRLMIDPVVVYFHPDSKNQEIHVDELKKLTDLLRDTVVQKVSPSFPVVDEPGPDVLRIRSAITDVVPANPVVNMASIASFGVPVDMGGASLEAEFLDSLSNERLAALVDRKLATPVDLKFYKGFTRWGHAEEAFEKWAGELLDELEKPSP